MSINRFDVIVAGSGLGSLTAAALLAKERLKVAIIEQNYLPGGCTSSYWRKGFVFESGATTVVGVDEGMPLQYVLDQTGIKINFRQLELPMQVKLRNGLTINRYQQFDSWLDEAAIKFGNSEKQKRFWHKCYEISQFVWQNSSRQLNFPPTDLKDLLRTAKSFDWSRIGYGRYAFITVADLLK
ncbi:MAG: NAD(P)-binding protein, partial [Cyclobacteriaceae bacterium]